VPLEVPTSARDAIVQSGRGHYAELLPIEYEPSAAYQRLFRAALASTARRLAVAVGVVTETVLAERGPTPVLVSLARAGTPVGVLMRRWAGRQGADVPHFTMSIVRDRGIDMVALRWLADRFPSESLVFVDGWTGKGAIRTELSSALAGASRDLGVPFVDDLAVLADPGSCVRTFGTRDDILVASACLNSTVSGLVSRTVLNSLIGPGDFHGAKFYAELRPQDVSQVFIESVERHFDDVQEEVAAGVAALARTTREPTWAGRREVDRLAALYGVTDHHLIKPGVGEATRVLLRRMPWRVLVRDVEDPAVAHVLRLAEERAVPVEHVHDLAFGCVGIVRSSDATPGAAG
jgi:hypothetical protein